MGGGSNNFKSKSSSLLLLACMHLCHGLAVDSLSTRRAYFVNLSNGAEAASALAAAGVPWAAIRIQSSHLEGNHYGMLLDGLDSNFLLHLAMGVECVVLDYGANRKQWPTTVISPGKEAVTSPASVPRALWQGLEFVRFAVHDAWGLPPPTHVRLRGHDARSLFADKVRSLPERTRRRLRYFRDFLPPNAAPPRASTTAGADCDSFSTAVTARRIMRSPSLPTEATSSATVFDAVRLRCAYQATTRDKQRDFHARVLRSASETNPSLVHLQTPRHHSIVTRSNDDQGGAEAEAEAGEKGSWHHNHVHESKKDEKSDDLWLPGGMVEYVASDYIAAGRGKVRWAS